MKAIVRPSVAAAVLIVAGFAGAVDAPADGIDLGAVKPKPATAAGNVIGGSSTQSANQKTTGSPGGTAGAAPGGIGSSIKSPLGAKGGIGPVGAPGAGKAPQSTQEETTSSSTDVQVKMPSNYKK